MNKINKNILIISSHADDHISCAGTVFKLQEERGLIPFEAVLTDSSRGQDFRSQRSQNKLKVSLMRLKELSAASKFLGIRQTFLLGQTDLNLTYSTRLVFGVAKIIRQVKPQIIFINTEFDAHPDHRTAFRIGLDAVKVAAMGVERQKLGEPFRVPMVLCVEQMLPDKIQILVDVTRYQDKKEQLLKIYASQMSPKALAFEQGLGAVRGYHLKKTAGAVAEGFSLQNEFPVLALEDNETDLF